MKILADAKLPLLPKLLGPHFDFSSCPSEAIDAERLRSVDVLLCRSVTKVNAELLEGTRVQYVVSASSGSDHLDTAWLAQEKIPWTAIPGCNAQSVADYVVCAVAALQAMGALTGRRAGIVGLGHVGDQVLRSLQALGFEVVAYDPVRTPPLPEALSVSLDEFSDRDIICLHPALTVGGPHPSRHLVDRAFLERQRPGCVLLNAARGSVVDNDALKKYGKHLVWCLDVFENEPHVDLDIIERAALCTPHIAGYAIQAKWRAAEMAYHRVMAFLGKSAASKIAHPRHIVDLHALPGAPTWQEVVLSIYDPREDARLMKEQLLGNVSNVAETFKALRNDYRVRHEFRYTRWTGATVAPPTRRFLQDLGIEAFSESA